MLALLLIVTLLWQLFAGTLTIAPVSRKQDPVAYWLVILGEIGSLAYIVLRQR